MKYQRINAPHVIVEAVQFNPHKHPWPNGVHSWDGEKARPRDGSWGYVDTVMGRVHVMGSEYIVDSFHDSFHCKDFEETFRPVINEDQPMIQDTQDLEAFMHRLLRAGVAPHEASREGLNYAVAMMPPTASAKESLDLASHLLEQATKNIGISAQQINEEATRCAYGSC